VTVGVGEGAGVSPFLVSRFDDDLGAASCARRISSSTAASVASPITTSDADLELQGLG
jgi:hypothetical protein